MLHKISRQFTWTVALLAMVLIGSASANAADWTRDDAAHLLRRAGFGGTPTQIDRLYALGRDGAVDYLLDGTLPDKSQAPFEHVELSPFVLDTDFDYRLQGPGANFELQRLRAWTLERAVKTDRPLAEKMTLFWHGLFTSGFREVRNVRWIADQDGLLRTEALGNYKTLTRDVIHGPAMIKYLNNDENLRGRPNENLARELMELFTMGEGNGYTEKDIPEVARALTGLTVQRRGEGSQFVAGMHDNGTKTIFGETGNWRPDDVITLIFSRPEPSTYLAKRLWQFFGMSEPSQGDIDAVAAVLTKNNWEVKPALKAIFTSPSFYSDQVKFAMIKSPFELEAMTLRLLEEPAEPRLATASTFVLRPMGEELFQPPNVKGWPGGERWITSSAIDLRYTLVAGLANGTVGANFGGRFRLKGPAATKAALKSVQASAQAPTTQPAQGATTAKAQTREERQAAAQAARRAKVDEARKQEQEKALAKMNAMPLLPPPDEMVAPSKLFAALGAEAQPEALVDAAIARFVQHPLAADKRSVLVDTIGKSPLKLADESSDRRIRQMLGLLMSTPEYQVE